MKQRFGVFLLVGLLTLAPAAVRAQEPAGELDVMIVTADRTSERLRDVSQNVTVITEDEISRSGAADLVDLLKKQGLQTDWTGSPNYGGESVNIRGSRSSMHGFDLAGDVLLLVDGRRAGSDNFSVQSLDNVERVEIIRGPGAVQYGSAAIGGVINIITKRGREKPELRLESGLGSWNRQRYKGFTSGRYGQFDAAVSASYTSSGDLEDGRGRRQNNSSLGHMAKYSLNLGWNLNGLNRLGLSFQGFDGREMGMGPQETSAYKNQYQNRDYYMAEALYEGSSEEGALNWSARYFLGRTNYELSRESTRAASLGERANYSDNKNKMQGGQAQLSYDFSRFKLIGGLDALYYDMEQNQPFSVHTSATTANHTQSDYLNIGAFLIGKAYLLEDRNLVLSAGTRYDYFKINADSIYAPNTASHRELRNDSRVDSFIPSFGLAYSPYDFLKLRANYSQAFRMPTPRQLGGIFSMGGSAIFVGNPDLEPEKSQTWDAGFDLAYQAFTFSLTCFATEYKDMIVALPVGSLPGRPNDRLYINVDKAYLSGLEIGTSFDLGQQFSWGFGLKPYLNLTTLYKHHDNNHTPLIDTAKTTLAYGLDFAHQEWGLSGNLGFTYYDRQVVSVSSGVPKYGPGGATVADLNVSQRLYEIPEAGEVKLKASVSNLFDKYYTTHRTDYMPGRGFYVGLAYHY